MKADTLDELADKLGFTGDAKNIYMVQLHNENQEWSADRAPVIALFNEYFGGSMNAIVFQELREARGLAYSAFAR